MILSIIDYLLTTATVKRQLIIFWRELILQELNHEDSPTRSDLLTPWDKIVNYTLGTLFILLWAISTTLNPSLLSYYRTTKTKASKLFQYLAAADFLTNIWSPLAYTHFMLSSELHFSSHLVLRTACIWACLVGCLAQVIGLLLAVSRAMKIVYPLQDYRQTLVMTYLVVYLVGMVVTDAAILVTREWFSDEKWGRWIMDVAVIVCFWSHFTHCYAGILVSIPTVIHLYFSTRFEIYLIL